MESRRLSTGRLATMGLMLAGFTVLGTACETEDLRAVAAGLEAVAGQLQRQDQDHDDDITFGEWLLSEFDD